MITVVKAAALCIFNRVNERNPKVMLKNIKNHKNFLYNQSEYFLRSREIRHYTSNPADQHTVVVFCIYHTFLACLIYTLQEITIKTVHPI